MAQVRSCCSWNLKRETDDSADIREFTPESWRDRIGVVFQDPILFEGTVHENIAYGSPGASRSEVEQAARQANCDFIWDLPNGFDTKSESQTRSHRLLG